ncbi:MAG: adenylyltransferase/cytidyltransferase family protein [Xanthobacteraceae bacterium]
MNERTSPAPVWIYADVVCDLFHHGHVEFFRRARALGDRLVVGLVGDADVGSYKPAPIMTFEERAAVVEGCRFVDRVLQQPAPLHCTAEFLDKIGATYCCHGDDMTAEQLRYWYGDLVSGGRLKVVSYTPNISTRLIVARIGARVRAEASGP